MSDSLTPIVKWAQNGPHLYVTAELSDVKDAFVEFQDDSLNFQGYGRGAKGENMYDFKLEFYRQINPEKSSYKITDRSIAFEIYKKNKTDDWPRLLLAEMKPVWLRIDFDKWKIESSEEEDLENQINKITFEQKIRSEIDRAKDDMKVYTKIAWLTIYNLIQFVCFALLFTKLMFCLYVHGQDAVLYFYDDVSDLILSCQVAAFIEIINPLVGIVKTGLKAPLMQVFGRSFILFILIVPEKRLHDDFVVLVLFIAWSAIEIFRYPFYLFNLHHYNNKPIAWLRYTLWIPLYPVGFISEAIIMYKSLPYMEEKKRLEFNLPNTINFCMTLKLFTQIYLFLYIPLCLYLLKHMWLLRQRKVNGVKRDGKTKQA